MAETTLSTNSLAAFFDSIKFKKTTPTRELEYPRIPLAGFRSSLETVDEIRAEAGMYVLSDN